MFIASCSAFIAEMSRSCMERPRAIRYTSTPSHGMRITKIAQKAFATPPMSWLRKMSKITLNSSISQAIHKKMINMVQNRPRIG